VSYCLDTSFLVSILFPDPHTSRAFAWLEALPRTIYVSDWAATEFFALVRRRTRTALVNPEVAEAALVEFEAFASSRAQRLPQSAPAGAHAAELARAPELKLSAADALHLALSAEGCHCLVTFDARLADAALAAGFRAEIPP
jgi:predicted nucleic acid-binding protein